MVKSMPIKASKTPVGDFDSLANIITKNDYDNLRSDILRDDYFARMHTYALIFIDIVTFPVRSHMPPQNALVLLTASHRLKWSVASFQRSIKLSANPYPSRSQTLTHSQNTLMPASIASI